MSFKNNDLTSYGDLEKHMYGGADAFSFFNREIVKCLPFFHKPVEIVKTSGTHNFGYSWDVFVNNDTADYLTNIFLTLELPEIELLPENQYGENGVLRWTENPLHNLLEKVTLSFNELTMTKLDNFSLDFISEFNIPEEKYKSYSENIGNVPELTNPNRKLVKKKLFIPLPLFFCNDTGNSIPLSNLTNTEIKIGFFFKNWENLLILENINSVDPSPVVPVVGKDIKNVPLIEFAKVYGTFVTVSDEERCKMGMRAKTLLIEQIQSCPRQMIGKEPRSRIDLLFKQSVKRLFFAVRNTTYKNVWSNYNYDNDKFLNGMFVRNTKNNIIESAGIIYGEKERVPEIPAEYFNYISPYYYSKRVPKKCGLYMYSFALEDSADPSGSVNLARIDTPVLNINFTEESLKSNDNFELVVLATSSTVIKIVDGVVKFISL